MKHTELKEVSLFVAIENSPKFSIFARACRQTGLDETLKLGGPYTLFIPSDAAFGRLPKEALDSLLLPENKERLTALLTYHIIPWRLASSDLKVGKVRTLSGKKCEFNTKPGRLAVDQAVITHFDIDCSNGIIHVIDQLIFPSV